MKRLHISDASASSLGALAVTARAFSSVILDCPWLYNSGWLSALLGMLIVLPAAVILGRMRRYRSEGEARSILDCVHPPIMRILTALLAAVAAFDAAVVSVSIGVSASYIAIGNVTTFYLLLPQFALCVWCLAFNGNAIGNAARIWGRLLICIITVIALFILPQYRPSWLTPILGPGIPTLLGGTFRCAGWYSLLIPAFLISEEDTTGGTSRFRPVRTTLACGLITALLLLLCGMLSPSLIHSDEATRFSGMDTLISNGRLALGLQLPMIVLWFASLFFLQLYDAWILAAMIQRVLPKLKSLVCIVIAVGAVILLSFSGWANRAGNLAEGVVLFPFLGTTLLVAAILIKKKGFQHA